MPDQVSAVDRMVVGAGRRLVAAITVAVATGLVALAERVAGQNGVSECPVAGCVVAAFPA